MGFVKFIIGLPCILVLLTFAFVNNDMATFSLWPTGIELTVSLSVAIVFLVLAGYFAGWFFTWLSYASIRSSLRAHKKQNKKLSKEQEKLVKEVEGLHGSIESLKAATPSNPKKSWKEKFKSVFVGKDSSSSEQE